MNVSLCDYLFFSLWCHTVQFYAVMVTVTVTVTFVTARGKSGCMKGEMEGCRTQILRFYGSAVGVRTPSPERSLPPVC